MWATDQIVLCIFNILSYSADCQAGNYYNMTTSKCEKCPVGSYQDEPGSISCKKCENGTEATLKGQTACMGKATMYHYL